MAMAAMTLRPPERRASTSHLPIVATSNDGVLPVDLLYEIMQLLPTESICRFRAVCRSWRSLLCHPDFIAAAHNPGPLLAVCVTDYPLINEVSVMDMESGDVVKRVNVATNNAEVSSMNHDRVVCFVTLHNRVCLLDLANDAVCLLPDHTPRPSYVLTWCMVGRAASTGEYKVLTIAMYKEPQVCKILSLGNSERGWMDIGHPPLNLVWRGRSFAIIDGFVYFLSDYNRSKYPHVHEIMVFDLEHEAWRPASASLQGPPKRRFVSLAELNGHLVEGYTDGITCIEMWFLVDWDRSHWSKRYTMTIPCYPKLFPHTCYIDFVNPLAVLDDGRIVIWMRVFAVGIPNEVLWIYDPRTKTFMDGTKLPKCSSVCVFAWSLLRSGRKSAIDMAAQRLLMARRHHRSESPSSTEDTKKKC